MNNNKRTYLILGIFAVIFTFFGGTLSYWQWNSSDTQQTAVNFTIQEQFSCSVDGGGDVSSADKMLAPASCTNQKYAIQRTITATADIKDTNATISMDLWLDINSIDVELSQSANFKYALTTNANSCTEGVIESGSFTGKSANGAATILNDKIYTEAGTNTYYLYVWLDAAEENQNTMDKHFSLSLNGSCETIEYKKLYKETLLNGADPVLENGMIPITLSDIGVVTVADTNQEWYNYKNKEWANAVLVKKDATAGVEGSKSREYYLNNPGTEILESDILAYYVWIPRYKYKVWLMDGTMTSSPQTIDIVFENSKTTKSVATQVGQYYTHPAFTFGTQELNGIWIGKFETTGTEDNLTILPNVNSLTSDSMILEDAAKDTSSATIIPYYSTKKTNTKNLELVDLVLLDTIKEFFELTLDFAGGIFDSTTGEVTFQGNNIYGLTSSTDSHMIKNSEWGAIAYLSHSIYGINEKIRINNYIDYTENYKIKTGCGALIENATYTNVCGISYGIPSTEEYTYPQSTTGNISGIFDISGGRYEEVMGNYNNQIGKSGFTILPNNKYYDLYTNTSISNCTLEKCGGTAIYETEGWYTPNNNSFINDQSPWFRRGGYHTSENDASQFTKISSTGLLVSGTSTLRSVIVKGT